METRRVTDTNMLPKKHRLRKTKDFQAVFAKRKGIREDGLLLKLGAFGGPQSRWGIVVSTKVSKKAVQRNRIRRLLSSAIQLELEKIQTGVDLVLVVLPGFEATGFSDIQQKVQRILHKASLLKHD